MIKKWTFNGETYQSEWHVRQAYGAATNTALPETYGDNVAEFWARYGIEYIEEAEPEPSLDDLKSEKFKEIDEKSERWRTADAIVISSLGFVADSDDRAYTDIQGLLIAYEKTRDAAKITFRDANNTFHEISYEQLKTLQMEVVENGQYMYEQKWSMQQAVSAAKDKEELDAIEIRFSAKSFLPENQNEPGDTENV